MAPVTNEGHGVDPDDLGGGVENPLTANLDGGGFNVTNVGQFGGSVGSFQTGGFASNTLCVADDSSLGSYTAPGFATVTLDTVQVDTRGEFDTANDEFTPDNTGWYFVAGGVRFTNVTVGGGSGTTELEANFARANSSPGTQIRWRTAPTGAGSTPCHFAGIVHLDTADAPFTLKIQSDQDQQFDSQRIQIWKIPV